MKRATTLAVIGLLTLASNASANEVISEAGTGAGQTRNPNGLAVDFETGRLFVADTKNNRIAVFDEDGNFERAFGWGVKDGKAQFQVCTTSCLEGIAGSGAGQLKSPTSIAVDNDPASPSHHSVYVVDRGNGRIEKFSPEGAFELAFGSPGEAEGQFSDAGAGIGGKGPLVGVGPAGTVHVLDSIKAGTEFEHRLQKFDPSGLPSGAQLILFKEPAPTWGLAVDSSGEFYVSPGSLGVRKYAADGSFLEELEPFEDGGIYAIAIGENHHLFAASGGGGAAVSVAELDAAGNRVRRFGYGALLSETPVNAIAPNSTETGIYLSEFEFGVQGGRVVETDFPPPGPLVFPKPCTADPIGNSKATLNAEVNPEGKPTTYRFQYISEADFEANLDNFKDGFEGAASTPESVPIGSDFKLHEASAQATGLVPETKYRCRAIATNADAPAGNPGPEGSFVTKAPLEILDTQVAAVGTEAATLNAVLNPLGISASGFFEYVDDAAFQSSGFATATKAPAGEPLEFGAGETPVLGSTQLTGLNPATTYHYRLVATNVVINPQGKTVISPARTFRTFSLASSALPDGRAHELVSPAVKNSAEVGVPTAAGGLYNKEVSVRINAAATSGEAVTYTSWTSFGEADGAPSASQYLSNRGASGWATENISPLGFNKQPLVPPYRGFTADLRFGAFYVDEPALTPEAQDGFQNLYLRDNQTGQIEALTIAAPELVGPTGFCAAYSGASADGSRAIFAGRGALAGTGAIPEESFNLYEWSATEGLKLVSVLPDGTPAPPVKLAAVVGIGEGTGFGAVGGRNCTMDQAPIRNAISADGSTIFWRYGGKYKESNEPLLARIGGTETVQLDAKVAGEKAGGGGRFWAATSDGSKAFFTAPGKLTAGAGAKGQLYRYDTESRTRINLTPGSVAPEILGVIGASEDATHVYFVGEGALTGEEENESGQKAGAGANNLYLWQEGEGLRFIAALADIDNPSWDSSPERLTARLSPDGGHLAFLSIASQALSGYDNTRASGEGCQPQFGNAENKLIGDPHCAQAYLYDAVADTLTCASCNPTGSRPLGPTELPGWTNPYEGPRYLSADGSKLFFESRDALGPADQNKRRDVYEFERAGSGSCEAEGPGYDPTSAGCLFLISTGTDDDDSFLIDASADGRDVFLSTRSVLTGWDTDGNYDVYDARIGGGFPEPNPQPLCLAEACKPALPPAPATSAPATPSFQGPGDAVHKPKKSKGKRKKTRKHRSRNRHGKAGQRKGAGR